MTGALVAMAPALAAKPVSISSVFRLLVSRALQSEMTATRMKRVLTSLIVMVQRQCFKPVLNCEIKS
eukprot:scaffold4420_cov107-Cylindrotheca_fusiformis.AAC.4